MSSYDTSSRESVAYAIRGVPLAEMALVVGCTIVATFIVTYTLSGALGCDKSISWVLSLVSCIGTGVVLSALYLNTGKESRGKSS